ncbi:type II toxin-antitoxin system ParD family antitoxin [Rhizobium sp. RU36D]|uniref:type II toxin-antitoxin system ParD family antitoxin n=1 Tax=Rhizobium sp. RU36D TaxID=1907415 RepID=UPI0009D7EBC4|nr:type II toxin-antitoxin system ParD family antitoxin [Rhizobium sp. RU36D]SMC62560.1 antitoxin ParD1/3/4 [Rhizobium sp. RU36D]
MVTMNISLPDPMKEWVETRTRAGGYADTSDYLRDLIRRDQEQAAKIAAMQILVDEGIQSGIGTRTKDELFAAAVTRAQSPGRL